MAALLLGRLRSGRDAGRGLENHPRTESTPASAAAGQGLLPYRGRTLCARSRGPDEFLDRTESRQRGCELEFQSGNRAEIDFLDVDAAHPASVPVARRESRSTHYKIAVCAVGSYLSIPFHIQQPEHPSHWR